MSKTLDKMWVRFGIYMSLVVLMIVIVFGLFVYIDQENNFTEFMDSLPVQEHNEMLRLIDLGMKNSDRALEIRKQYYTKEPSDLIESIISGVIASLLLGLIAALMSAKLFLMPLNSIIETAEYIAKGDLSKRVDTTNVTGELLHLIKQINFMAESLDQMDYERKQSIAATSHELRTPLTILQARLHALNDGVITPSPTEFHDLLYHTEHLVRLVGDLYTLSTIEAKALAVILTPLNLNELLLKFVPSYIQRAKNFGINIQLSGENAYILGDEDRLRQVLTNIIENTLYYASEGGVLEINVSKNKEYVVLELSDRGAGFSDNEIKWIFNPFFRGDTNLARNKPGVGLGLSIVQTIVTQHNGNIEVFNRSGGGACFRLLFPLATPTEHS